MAGRLLFFVVLLAIGLAGPAAAQRNDSAAVAARIGGSWYGVVDSPDRPRRYLEILSVAPNTRGGYSAQAVFGWGDGSVSLTAAEVTADAKTTTLSLTAPNGSKLRVAFPEKGGPSGTYQAAGEPERSMRLERLRDAVNYGALLGVWSARRGAERRIFDVKRVLTTGPGTVLAVGQLGFAEKPEEMRQLVAPVTGEPATAQIAWATAVTAVELRRTKATELAGTFRRTDGTAPADKIVFKRAAQPAPAAGTGGEIGQRFPDFTLTTMDGRTVRLSDFRGRPVVVNMFQAWCIWCMEEFSVWRAGVQRYGDKLVILPVVYGTTSPEWMQQSEKSKRYGVPIYGTEKSPVAFQGIPRSWILDKDGIVIDKMGYQRAHDMFARLDKVTK